MTEKDNDDNIKQSPDSEVTSLIRSGLIEDEQRQQERPPEPEDYTSQRQNSLDVLTTLLSYDSDIIGASDLPSVLLLCSQHCSSSPTPSLPESQCCWSSPEHRDQADNLLRAVTDHHKATVSQVLSQDDFMLFKKIMKELQPKLEKFISNPVSVCSLVWLAGHLTDHGVDGLVPQLLPHALHLTDCWLPYYKLWGCHLIDILVRGSSGKELVFYGRAELLSDTLYRMLSHNDTGVVLAAGHPLVTLTRLRHRGTGQAEVGPGDTLVSELVTSLDISSEQERRRVYCDMLLDSVTMLGEGVARWVSRVCEAMLSCLDNVSPPVSVFSVLTHMVTMVPECMSREMATLLPALIKFIYTVSWLDNVDPALVSLASDTAQQLATCDPTLASSLCHGLPSLSVNKTFDTAVNNIMSKLTVAV